MKKLTLLFALMIVLLARETSAALTIVSDLDDTIKITNSANEIEAARRALFSDEVFIGMPEFLNAVKSYADEVHVLSASPILLKPKIQSTFKKVGISVDSLILKNPLYGQKIYDFKLKELKRLLNKNSGDDFILIGDDTGHDPEVYAEIQKEFPNRVLASYIHVVKDRKLPSGAIKYWTAFDLYLREYKEGRMPAHEVSFMGELLLKEDRMKQVIPGFADCPKTPLAWVWQLRTRFAKEAALLMGKVNIYCTASHSVIE
jgi:hypothetical protein